LPAGLTYETGRYDICRHFGLDLYLQDHIRVHGPGFPEAASEGAGVLWSEKEYEAVLEHIYPWPTVNRELWLRWAEQQKAGDAVLWFTMEGFFWFPRTLLGVQEHLFAFYDQPELIHRINNDLTEWMLKVIDEICFICAPDFMTFAEDMSYNNGPMLSKDLFDEFLRPCYDRVVPVLKNRGILPCVDSDGEVKELANWLEEAGIEGIIPLERQAGVDIAGLRKDHPRMRFIGHFDKMTMTLGEGAMRAEFERLLPTASKGGFIISCDHQTPPGVSYSDYQLYLALFREYAEKAGQISR